MINELGEVIKPGARKVWHLRHRRKKDGPYRLVSRHYTRNEATSAKWALLGMGGYTPGEHLKVERVDG